MLKNGRLGKSGRDTYRNKFEIISTYFKESLRGIFKCAFKNKYVFRVDCRFAASFTQKPWDYKVFGQSLNDVFFEETP